MLVVWKQPLINVNGLPISHVNLLQDALDAKQSLLSDVAGLGVSLRYGTKLRKVFGTGGITVSHYINASDLNDAGNFQVEVSAANLQSALSDVQQKKQLGFRRLDFYQQGPL